MYVWKISNAPFKVNFKHSSIYHTVWFQVVSYHSSRINVSQEMEPKLWQLIISSWMLHNKSREFIQGPEVPSSSQVGDRQAHHHLLSNLINMIAIFYSYKVGGWTMNNDNMLRFSLSSINSLSPTFWLISKMFHCYQTDIFPGSCLSSRVKVMYMYTPTPLWL